MTEANQSTSEGSANRKLGDTFSDTRKVLLASEGRPISAAAIATAARLAIDHRASVHVLSVARIWGSMMGLQHPGLQPSQRELQAQRDIVGNAIEALEKQGIVAKGEVMRSRSAAKSIAGKANTGSFLGLVMSADPEPHWLARGLMWSHEPYRVRRLTKLPVHLAIIAATEEVM